MKKIPLCVAAIVCGVVCGVYAMYSVSDKGTWPESWPKQMEPLRDQSRSLHGGLVDRPIHEIPFGKREDFEAAWPHILKVKSQGAPLILVAGPSKTFGHTMQAGVRIWCPPRMADNKKMPEQPLPGDRPVRSRWLWAVFIELVVDGEVVDLNRIPLPADTPIVDERFPQDPAKATRKPKAEPAAEPAADAAGESPLDPPPPAASTPTPR